MLLPLLLAVAVLPTEPAVVPSLRWGKNQTPTPDSLVVLTEPVLKKKKGGLRWWTHHFLGVVGGHVDLFAVLPHRVAAALLPPAGPLRQQPLLIQLIHVCNWRRRGEGGASVLNYKYH